MHTVWLFDLLREGDEVLLGLPLSVRKSRLEDLIARVGSSALRYSEGFDDPVPLIAAVDRMGLEGIVSKKRNARYRSGPSHSWLKINAPYWRNANRERWKLFEKKGLDA